MIIVLAYPRKLSSKPVVERAENNPIFSVLQNAHVLEIGSIRSLWEKGVKINAQTEGLVECLFQKQLGSLFFPPAIPHQSTALSQL